MAHTSTRTVPASSNAAATPALTAISRAMRWAQTGYGRSLLLVMGVALLARGLFIGAVPLWSDEAFMGVLMRRSVGAMIDVVHNDNHPPLQYLLVRAATAVNDSPTALRLPSVMAGLATVPLAAALGRRIGGDRAGLATGLVTALMPLLVLWSRDARMYALAITMVLAMSLALWRAVEQPRPGRVALYAATVVIALYSHYLTALAVPAQLAAALLFLRPSRATAVRVVLAAGAAGLTLVPWLVYAAPQFRHVGQPYWATPFSVRGVAATLGALAVHPQPTSAIVFGAAAILAFTLVFALRAYRQGTPGARGGMRYLLGCAGFAVVLLSIISLKQPLLDQRFTNLYTTGLLPFVGLAIAGTRRAWVAGLAALSLGAVCGLEVSTLGTPDVPGAIAPLAGTVDPGRDVVALNGPYRYFQVLYYGDPATRAMTRVVFAHVPWYDGLAAYRPGDVVPLTPDAPGRVYLVTDPGQADPAMPDGMHLVARRCAPGSCLETWSH